MAYLLIYLPAFNEEHSIRRVIKNIPKHYEGITNVDIIVIDDGSTDNTATEAQDAGAIVISHKFNKGVGVVFQTAVKEALSRGADILCSIDADGQFNVKQISELINPIILGKADFCVGNRFAQKRHPHMPKIKYWGNMVINRIISIISGAKLSDVSSGFRAYSGECLLSLNLQSEFTYTHETILDLLNKGFTIKQVPVSVQYFQERISRVANSIIRYGFQTFKIIFKSLKDYSPFYFFGSISLSVFILGITSGLFVLSHWIINGQITPYKSFGLIAVTLCLVAVIFFILALIADMLGRIRQNQEKLLYLLKKIHFSDRNVKNISQKD